MNQNLSDSILYALCFSQLTETRVRLLRRQPRRYSREEIRAEMLLVDRIYETASGAAVTLEWKDEETRPLVNLVEYIRDLLEWNEETSV